MFIKYKQSGLTIVEIIIVVAVIIIAFSAILQLESFSIASRQLARMETQASFLAEEAIEGIRVMRDEDWGANIASLSDGAVYYLSVNGGQWDLSLVDPGAIFGIFDRKIVFQTGQRDVNDNLVDSGGVADSDTKIITISVEWSFRDQAKILERKVIITNWVSKM